MARENKYGSEGNDLRDRDAEKSYSTPKSAVRTGVEELIGNRIMNESSRASAKKGQKKKVITVVLDILVGLLILAIAAGIIVGTYFLFKYYSNDYDTATITYTFIYDGYVDPAEMIGKDMFCDDGETAHYFGEITDVYQVDHRDGYTEIAWAFEITVTAKYRDDKGYEIDDNRIAVGRGFGLRSGEEEYFGTVVELKRQK